MAPSGTTGIVRTMLILLKIILAFFYAKPYSLKIIPEEIYAVSHHVHHALSDQPGDPYNAQGGFMYCFLADVNHQPIARNMDEACLQKMR
jgi:fatty-acid desaturase